MSGHGHVTPNPDGSKARCGGPAICSACAIELARVGKPDDQILLQWVTNSRENKVIAEQMKAGHERLVAELVAALEAQVLVAERFGRNAGFSDRDIADCTAQARAALAKAGAA